MQETSFKMFCRSQVKVRPRASSLCSYLIAREIRFSSYWCCERIKIMTCSIMSAAAECWEGKKRSEGGVIRGTYDWRMIDRQAEKKRGKDYRRVEIMWGRIWIYNPAHVDHKSECTQVTGGSRESAHPFVRVLYFDSRLGPLPVSSNAPFSCRLHVGEWK